MAIRVDEDGAVVEELDNDADEEPNTEEEVKEEDVKFGSWTAVVEVVPVDTDNVDKDKGFGEDSEDTSSFPPMEEIDISFIFDSIVF